MPGRFRRALRRARRGAWYAAAVALVLMALGAGITSQLLPLAERHPERIAEWLGQRAGRPVSFDRVETAWTRRGPLLRLDGLRIGEGGDAVSIGAAEVLVAQYSGLLPGRSLTELRLRNLELTLVRDDNGRWRVRGLPGQDTGRDPFTALERLGELQVIGGSLTVDAPGLGLHAVIPRIDVRLRVDGSQVRAASRAWMDGESAPLRAAARFDRDSGDGRLYAGMDGGDLDAWSPLLRMGGIAVEDGHGRAEAWADLRDSRIGSLAARLDLEGVGLRGAALGDDAPMRVAFDDVEAGFEWTQADDGWRVDVPLLRVAAGGREWRSGNVAVQVGSHVALAAERIEAAPLLRVLALSDRIGPGARDWLARADANAVLADVAMAGSDAAGIQGRARVESIRFAPVGDRPGLDGLGGELLADGHGLVFGFDPGAPLRFDWPSGFGVVHEVALRGEVSAWQQDGGWQVQAPALRVDGDGYGVDLRGGLLFQGDGSRPRIDMAARLDEAAIPVAKGFWVRYLMPEQAVEWLDAALVGGRMVNGRAVVSGDLDDWPFDAASGRASTGLFHAQAELADATLKFQPDWPAAERMQGTVRFIANGFDFHGGGEIAGVGVEQLEAGIADFGRAELAVSTRTASDAGSVISMLQQSPLSVHALDGMRADGAMEGNFAMVLPLHGSGAGPRIEGRAQLAGVQAAMPEWELALDNVRGALEYDEHGFLAPQLSAWQSGRPGVLTLRAGTGHVLADANAFEGELRAGLEASELLARAPQLDWLGPHVSGRSTWTVGVAMPREGGGGQPHLLLRSGLVGTGLDLPEPLRKAPAVPLPARIHIPLPLGEGDIGVQLGQRMALRAHAGDGPAAVRVLMGGGEVEAPADGLVIEGRARELAALEWAGLIAVGGGPEEGEGVSTGPALELREVDVQVDRLLLAGGSFGGVHVTTGTGSGEGGTLLQFNGEAMAGTLALPGAGTAALTGDFERLHWQRQAGAADNGSEAVAEAEATGEGPDPALIPPIRLSVADLQVDQARLGNATLQTSRIPGGMRIEQLETQSPLHHLTVSGEWTGRGEQAITRTQTRVASGNFGQLLEGLGYHGHLRGGDGRLELTASWPASPAGFRAELLEGHMQLLVKDGQIVELEPGAGRLLGLLSIAELPRRLSLDFRDFFNRGFAFNRIEGDIHVESGRARSDGLVMDGPAATIHIAGRTDLRARTYDQTVEVLPKSGNVLTAVGAIAGGPVGAAVGAMANAMLRKPLSGLGATTYRITGPWDEPQVDVARRDPPQVADNDKRTP